MINGKNNGLSFIKGERHPRGGIHIPQYVAGVSGPVFPTRLKGWIAALLHPRRKEELVHEYAEAKKCCLNAYIAKLELRKERKIKRHKIKCGTFAVKYRTAKEHIKPLDSVIYGYDTPGTSARRLEEMIRRQQYLIEYKEAVRIALAGRLEIIEYICNKVSIASERAASLTAKRIRIYMSAVGASISNEELTALLRDSLVNICPTDLSAYKAILSDEEVNAE